MVGMKYVLHFSWLLGGMLCLFFSSCKDNDTINIRSFYYPVNQLSEGLIYEYHPVNNDSFPKEYWFFKSIQTDTALYLTGTYYDEFFAVRQFFRSEIVSNGVLLTDLFISEVDSAGQLTQHPAEVVYGNVFPFEVRDSGGIFLMQLKWNFSDDPPVSTTLTRNRRYIGKRSYPVEGQPNDIVAFHLREEVDDKNQGSWVKEYEGLEYYALNIGLVYYKKEIDNQFVLEYALRDRYTMDIFESRFRKRLEETVE